MGTLKNLGALCVLGGAMAGGCCKVDVRMTTVEDKVNEMAADVTAKCGPNIAQSIITRCNTALDSCVVNIRGNDKGIVRECTKGRGNGGCDYGVNPYTGNESVNEVQLHACKAVQIACLEGGEATCQ
jgi:hypothetical protein